MDDRTSDGPSGTLPDESSLLARIYRETPHCVLLTRPDGAILHANPAACTALGRTEEELRRAGRHGVLVLDGEAARLLAHRVRTGKAAGDIELRRADGSVIRVQAASAIAHLPDGSLASYIAFADPRKQDGQADSQSEGESPERQWQREALLAAILDGTGDGILVVGHSGAVLRTNPRFQELWRIPAELVARGSDAELLRHVVGQLADPPGFLREVERLYGVPDPVLDHVLLADGRVFERYSAPFPHEGPRARLWSFRDVTERVRSDEALTRSNRFLRTVIDTALDGYWVAGPDGAIRDVNDTACEMLGYTRAELLAMRVRDVDAVESAADVEAHIRRIRSEGRDRFETRHRRKDGKLVDVEMSVRRLELEDGPVVGFSRDLTDRKRMQERVALSSRLAGMGTLVAGVAHEVNNPLAAVLSGDGFALEALRALLDRVDRGTAPPADVARTLREVVEALDEAQESGQRIAQIVRSMAALANPDPTRTRTRLATVVAAAVRWLPPFVSEAADLRVEVHGAPEVLAAPGQLEQLLVNLVVNAARSIPAGRRGTVTVRCLAPGPGRARLEVVDDGVGIDPAVLPRIFEPFFTTRPAGERRGAGLGLAVSHAIAEAHGGTLEVESTPGRGSIFRLDMAAEPPGPDSSASPTPTGP